MVVTNATPDVAGFDNAKKFKYRSLYYSGTNYTDSFWLGNNAMVLTPEEEEIIKQLEKQANYTKPAPPPPGISFGGKGGL